jgi:sugar phosphate isomerase/epimerase
MMVQYSYNMLSYATDPDLEHGIHREAEFGYDGVEFVGEPAEIDTQEANELLDDYGLEASSVCSVYTKNRDLTAADESTRENAIQYTKDVAVMTDELNADVFVVRPGPVGRVSPDNPENEWGWAVEGIRNVSDFVSENGLDVTLGIEPWNRYETHLINTVDEALNLMNDVNRDNLGVWADLFHMNIEEDAPSKAIAEAGDNLVQLHGADTNRAAPGRGHYEWEPVITSLKDIGYDGWISFELLPATADPFDVLETDTEEARKFYDQYTKESIQFFKEIWSTY